MDELDNSSNRYYHLEEISPDDIDLEKDCELIPVAHYTRVSSRSSDSTVEIIENCFSGKYHSDQLAKILSISSQSDTRK